MDISSSNAIRSDLKRGKTTITKQPFNLRRTIHVKLLLLLLSAFIKRTFADATNALTSTMISNSTWHDIPCRGDDGAANLPDFV